MRVDKKRTNYYLCPIIVRNLGDKWNLLPTFRLSFHAGECAICRFNRISDVFVRMGRG